ncbi:MAG: class I SAM-dependent methyltransferase [Candidatus Bathyarchaeia archaeon]
MSAKGDTERQAFLRDKMIKSRGRSRRKSRYVSKLLSAIPPNTKLLDVGCGTAHIIQELAKHCKSTVFVGLDVSPSMLKYAKSNVKGLPNVMLVEADGMMLPFSSASFDIVTVRLAEYSPKEVYRVLKTGGCFFEYGLGPEANKEFIEFFNGRIERASFFFPKNMGAWKEEVTEQVEAAGFVVDLVSDYKETEYHGSIEELADLAEMIPLVKNFNRKKDMKRIKALAAKHESREGIKTTWHYFILEARKP